MNLEKKKEKEHNYGEINSGAIKESGSVYYKRDIETDYLKDKQQLKEEKFAYNYYNAIKNRNRVVVVDMVHKNTQNYGNTDISKKQIEEVFMHIFDTEYELADGIGLFKPNENMAYSFQRLIDMPDKIKEKEIILLKHEYAERQYMKNGMKYEQAHEKANQIANYEVKRR